MDNNLVSTLKKEILSLKQENLRLQEENHEFKNLFYKYAGSSIDLLMKNDQLIKEMRNAREKIKKIREE